MRRIIIAVFALFTIAGMYAIFAASENMEKPGNIIFIHQDACSLFEHPLTPFTTVTIR